MTWGSVERCPSCGSAYCSGAHEGRFQWFHCERMWPWHRFCIMWTEVARQYRKDCKRRRLPRARATGTWWQRVRAWLSVLLPPSGGPNTPEPDDGWGKDPWFGGEP